MTENYRDIVSASDYCLPDRIVSETDSEEQNYTKTQAVRDQPNERDETVQNKRSETTTKGDAAPGGGLLLTRAPLDVLLLSKLIGNLGLRWVTELGGCVDSSLGF